MTLTEHHVRRLIIASVEERRFLRDWHAMVPDATRDHDLIVILDALNERSARIAAERKADSEAREQSVQRDRARAEAAAKGVLS